MQTKAHVHTANPSYNRVGIEWEKVIAKRTIITELAAKLSDGSIHSLSDTTTQDFSLEFLEYVQNRSHILNGDGDVSMMSKEIVQKFYEDENIEVIYSEETSNDIDLFLVLNQEVDQLDLRLAKLQNKISKQYPKINIEIMYTTKDFFNRDSVSSGSIAYPRR